MLPGRKKALLFAACTALAVAETALAQPPGSRRALIIGINDYSASRLRVRTQRGPAPQRDWPNLSGAVNDAGILGEMLELLYGFEPHDIVTLTDQSATREAILQRLNEHLLAPAKKGDVLFFYFAGHGSQVHNSLSDEPDKLDESIVPADSRAGALDIRDKELRRFFNRILDKGAKLTVILDNCHSGSGARGLTNGARPRGIRRDQRDIADGLQVGLRPEDRSALVLSAAQDYDSAWETRDSKGMMHGAFSWAWIRAMRDSSAGESAAETFQRAQARLRGETPFQEPVLAGNSEMRFQPFLGTRRDRRTDDRTVVAVEKRLTDGTVMLQGGWASGLSVDSELRVWGDGGELTVRLIVTKMVGLGRSEARVESGRTLPLAIRPGALLELVGWAAPPGRPLRVHMPRVASNTNALTSLALRLQAQAKERRVRWVSDPSDDTPTHVLRRGAKEWELIEPDGDIVALGPEQGDAFSAIGKVRAGSSLFVQLPGSAALIGGLAVGPGTDREGIEPTERAEDADYILVGRFPANRRLEYAWLRPQVTSRDRRRTGLPVRTAWVAAEGGDATLRDAVNSLRDSALRLRRIHGWHQLESPPAMRSPYRLALRRGDELLKDDAPTIGENLYRIVLRAPSTPPPTVAQRFYYVFIIDSHGKSFLAYPPSNSGSVENRLPIGPPPREIDLGQDGEFEVQPPYGVDSYFLLTTDEPLPNPGVLEWDGVRAPSEPPTTALEELLMLTGTSSRSSVLITPATWSIEKTAFESVPPRRSSKPR